MITAVTEIGRSCREQLVNGDSFGKGLMSAIFQEDGTLCSRSELLDTSVTTRARSWANPLKSKNGNSSGPQAVLLSLERKFVTTWRGILDILASSGISISAGATYSGSEFMLRNYSLIMSGWMTELINWGWGSLPVMVLTVDHQAREPLPDIQDSCLTACRWFSLIRWLILSSRPPGSGLDLFCNLFLNFKKCLTNGEM